MSPINNRMQGQSGEKLAASYLGKKGYKILQKNYRYEHGEIDLVAEEGEELVFIEVKSRRTNAFGEPEDAVTEEKQEKIYEVADGYLYEHEIENRPIRFDVVAIEFRNGRADIRHIKDAF